MSATDVWKVKKLAARLGVRDSDVIRFAVKSALARLGPLNDPEMHGRSLVPVFVEWGSELLRFFDIDAARLETIVNEGVDAERRVERDDIALLALTGSQEPYAALKLSQLDNRRAEPRSQTPGQLAEGLRQYLYAKYVYRNETATAAAGEKREPLRLAVTDHVNAVEA